MENKSIIKTSLIIFILLGVITITSFTLNDNTYIGRKAEVKKYGNLNEYVKDLDVLRDEVRVAVPASHNLYDYFQESLGIIERLALHTKQDASQNDKVGIEIGLREAERLSSFLREEMNLAQTRQKTNYKNVLVTEIGFIQDGKFDNGPLLRVLLKEVKSSKVPVRFIFEAGIYYFKGLKGRATIELIDIHNITFEGKGDATFLCDGVYGKKDNLLIQQCNNIEFKNISIDNSPLPFTLAKITGVLSGNQIEVEICKDYPIPDESYSLAKYLRGLVHNPEDGHIDKKCGDPRIVKLEDMGGKRFRLTLDDNSLSGQLNMTKNFTIGNHFSIHPRGRPVAGHSVSIRASKHLLFNHFNVYAADDMVFLISASEGVKLLDCNIQPAPGRSIMSNADGFHCPSNRKGIYLERCRIFNMNDDCMNFYAKYANVGEVSHDRIFTVSMTVQQNKMGANFNVGDAVAFMNSNTGEFDGVSIIESINTVEWGGKKDVLQIVTKEPINNIISRRSSGRADFPKEREYTPSGADNYRAAMAIKSPFEHMILNLDAKNDGFIIRNCQMGYNRATGFKCKASNGVIRNTRFYDQVVLFLNEPGWGEGTYPTKIEMTNDTVDLGIQYLAKLPGKGMNKELVAKYMKYITLKDIIDRSGKSVLSPQGIN